MTAAAAALRPRHWSASYLGLPWQPGGLARSGISCWGMVWLPYAEELGVTLPSYVGTPDAQERREIEIARSGDRDLWPWYQIDESEVREFDLVMFRLGGIEGHVGLIPWRGSFLHVAEGKTSKIERYDSELWRLTGKRFLRHRECVSSGERASSCVSSGERASSCVSSGERASSSGKLIVLPAFDPLFRRIDLTMPQGGSVLDAVKLALPFLKPEQYERLRVTIGEDVLPFEMWERVRPKLWGTVLIRVTPGATDLFRALLLLAVTAAAIATAYFVGPLIASGLTITSVAGIQAVTSITAAALSAAGSLAVNFQIPQTFSDAREARHQLPQIARSRKAPAATGASCRTPCQSIRSASFIAVS